MSNLMSNVEALYERLSGDPEVMEFKLKSKKDGLIFVQTKDQSGVKAKTVEGADDVGVKQLMAYRASVGQRRHEHIRSLRIAHYSVSEIAAIFKIDKDAIEYALNNDYDPHP